MQVQHHGLHLYGFNEQEQMCNTKDDNTAALDAKKACKSALSECKNAQVAILRPLYRPPSPRANQQRLYSSVKRVRSAPRLVKLVKRVRVVLVSNPCIHSMTCSSSASEECEVCGPTVAEVPLESTPGK